MMGESESLEDNNRQIVIVVEAIKRAYSVLVVH